MSCVFSLVSRLVTRAFVSGIQSSNISFNGLILHDTFQRYYSTSGNNGDNVSITSGSGDNNPIKPLLEVPPPPEPIKCDPVVPQEQKEPQQQQQLDSRWQGFRLGPRFISVVSGLPKDFSASTTFRKGQFGDDAWMQARNATADVIGVADGVGGWRNYGIDPGEFSFSLMRACERLVEVGWFLPSKPGRLLALAYNRIQENNHVQGSSTACVLALCREDATLYCANLGDSGFVVVRQGRIIHRSEEQTHCFNTPFQLSCPPPGEKVLCDSPESADISQMSVEDGDVILLATDGVFDNLPEHILVSELIKVEGEKDPVRLQNAANSIALMARTLAFDSKYMSPFSESARRNGINAIGGKPDDITVLLATVAA